MTDDERQQLTDVFRFGLRRIHADEHGLDGTDIDDLRLMRVLAIAVAAIPPNTVHDLMLHRLACLTANMIDAPDQDSITAWLLARSELLQLGLSGG